METKSGFNHIQALGIEDKRQKVTIIMSSLVDGWMNLPLQIVFQDTIQRLIPTHERKIK